MACTNTSQLIQMYMGYIVSQKSEITIIIILLCVLKYLLYDHPHTVAHSPRWVACMYDYMYLC